MVDVIIIVSGNMELDIVKLIEKTGVLGRCIIPAMTQRLKDEDGNDDTTPMHIMLLEHDTMQRMEWEAKSKEAEVDIPEPVYYAEVLAQHCPSDILASLIVESLDNGGRTPLHGPKRPSPSVCIHPDITMMILESLDVQGLFDVLSARDNHRNTPLNHMMSTMNNGEAVYGKVITQAIERVVKVDPSMATTLLLQFTSTATFEESNALISSIRVDENGKLLRAILEILKDVDQEHTLHLLSHTMLGDSVMHAVAINGSADLMKWLRTETLDCIGDALTAHTLIRRYEIDSWIIPLVHAMDYRDRTRNDFSEFMSEMIGAYHASGTMLKVLREDVMEVSLLNLAIRWYPVEIVTAMIDPFDEDQTYDIIMKNDKRGMNSMHVASSLTTNDILVVLASKVGEKHWPNLLMSSSTGSGTRIMTQHPGSTPLHYTKTIHTTRTLFEMGQQVGVLDEMISARDFNGSTPLHSDSLIDVMNQDSDTSKYCKGLPSIGNVLQSPNADGLTPIHVLARATALKEDIWSPMLKKVDPMELNMSGTVYGSFAWCGGPPLCIAIERGNVEMVRMLIDNGISSRNHPIPSFGAERKVITPLDFAEIQRDMHRPGPNDNSTNPFDDIITLLRTSDNDAIE